MVDPLPFPEGLAAQETTSLFLAVPLPELLL